MEKLTRGEMVDLVGRLMRGEGSDEEANEWINEIHRSVPHPDVSGMIFYPEEELTSEEIIDRAISYRPIEL